MEKSSDAFRTISEVADDLDLPQHVLRFWETRFPHIRPLKRAGGRRYYRPADVALLRTIRQLLYDEGYTIKGVQRLLKEQGARSLRSGESASLPELSEIDPVAVSDEPEPRNGIAPAPAAALPAAPPSSPRCTLLELLGTIEDCTHILDALRRTT